MHITIPNILRKLTIEDNGHHLSINGNNFPERISLYLKEHFGRSFVSDIKKVKNKRGHVFYNAIISYENTLYRLKFNEDGAMVLKETEPLFELDDTEYEMID